MRDFLSYPLTNNGDVISESLRNSQHAHVLRAVRVLRPEWQRLAVEAVLGKEQQCAHLLAKLEHQAVVVVAGREKAEELRGDEGRTRERE